MVKLLQFNPDGKKETIKSQLKTMIEDDIWMGCTPDLPALRYKASIPVFIWDELNMYQALEKKLGVNDNDYEVINYMVSTKAKLLPFFNDDPSMSGPTRNVLPASPTWNKSLAETENKININPRPVQGKLVHMNLFALRLLDIFYSNSVTHNRHWETIVHKDGREEQAWIYLMPTVMFSKYHPHENEYRLHKGFSPKACSVIRPHGTAQSGDGRFSFKVPTT